MTVGENSGDCRTATRGAGAFWATARAVSALLIAGLLSGCPAGTTGQIGTAACLGCHDGRSAPDRRDFLLGAHGSVSCEECHGGGFAHFRVGGRNGLFIDNPGRRPFEDTPALCARCHAETTAGYRGTAHFRSEAASCNDCHDVHAPGGYRVPVERGRRLDNAAFAELCGDCHAGQTQEFLASGHAVSGVVSCGNCHAPHAPSMLTAPPRNNQLCQQCHASFFLGLDTEEAVDAHTGDFHPVDPAGSGASRCTGCHMPPLRQTGQPGGAHSHTLMTVAPSVSNEAIALGQTPPPNSCAGTLGCHDASVPGSGPPHDVNDAESNRTLQALYEQIGQISIGRSLP